MLSKRPSGAVHPGWVLEKPLYVMGDLSRCLAQETGSDVSPPPPLWCGQALINGERQRIRQRRKILPSMPSIDLHPGANTSRPRSDCPLRPSASDRLHWYQTKTDYRRYRRAGPGRDVIVPGSPSEVTMSQVTRP